MSEETKRNLRGKFGPTELNEPGDYGSIRSNGIPWFFRSPEGRFVKSSNSLPIQPFTAPLLPAVLSAFTIFFMSIVVKLRIGSSNSAPR